jgi:hypothetical protein
MVTPTANAQSAARLVERFATEGVLACVSLLPARSLARWASVGEFSMLLMADFPA